MIAVHGPHEVYQILGAAYMHQSFLNPFLLSSLTNIQISPLLNLP